MSSRTLKVQSPHMRGDDAKAWERTLNAQLKDWSIDHRVPVDGAYSVEDRSITASVLYGLGIATTAMVDGVTPDLRIKVRNKRLTPGERKRYDERSDWRKRFRERVDAGHGDGAVHRPVAKLISDAWGYHPPVHDGIDLICPPSSTLYAPVRARVVDARSSGWWGKGAQASAGHPVSDGDGIIQLEALVTVGPIKAGMHLAFGHAEHATVRVGQTVDAGDVIGKAGFANAWHVHFMVNRGEFGTRGLGSVDPEPIVDYCMKHG